MLTSLPSKYSLKTCGRCGGDAYLDGEELEWRCLQCGRGVTALAVAPAFASSRASQVQYNPA